MEINSSSRSNEKRPLEHSTPANGETNKQTEKEKSTSAFVNQAAIAWHENRRKWTGDQSRRTQRLTKDPIIRGYDWAVCGVTNFMCPIASEIGSTLQCMDGLHPQDVCRAWSTTYEDLLSTNERFLEPIPLPEMVDFLVDIWHDEGLFD